MLQICGHRLDALCYIAVCLQGRREEMQEADQVLGAIRRLELSLSRLDVIGPADTITIRSIGDRRRRVACVA